MPVHSSSKNFCFQIVRATTNSQDTGVDDRPTILGMATRDDCPISPDVRGVLSERTSGPVTEIAENANTSSKQPPLYLSVSYFSICSTNGHKPTKVVVRL